MSRVDGVRLVRGLALLAWALLFDWLWLSGDANRYVGQRTAWVVAFGAVFLSIAAVAQLALAVTTGARRGPTRRDMIAMTALVAPVLCAVAIPAPLLGSLAVERKGSYMVNYAHFENDRYRGSLYALAAATDHPDEAAELGVRPGTALDIDGFVSGGTTGGLELSRFFSLCCAADAVPFSISVLTAPGDADVPKDTWLRVQGTVRQRQDEFVLEATAITEIEAPSKPYAL